MLLLDCLVVCLFGVLNDVVNNHQRATEARRRARRGRGQIAVVFAFKAPQVHRRVAGFYRDTREDVAVDDAFYVCLDFLNAVPDVLGKHRGKCFVVGAGHDFFFGIFPQYPLHKKPRRAAFSVARRDVDDQHLVVALVKRLQSVTEGAKIYPFRPIEVRGAKVTIKKELAPRKFQLCKMFDVIHC